MDKIEKYIREQRSSFDDKYPSEALWHRINSQLAKKTNQVFLFRHMWKAAAIVLFAAVIGLLIDRQYPQEQWSLSQVEMTQGISFNEVENYYVKLIEVKQEEISQFIDAYPEVDENLLADIDKLDSSYQELKKQVRIRPDEKIIDAMVLNLQTRIEILNQQLNVLEKIKNLKEQNDETTEI
jgi:hypothetical protein